MDPAKNESGQSDFFKNFLKSAEKPTAAEPPEKSKEQKNDLLSLLGAQFSETKGEKESNTKPQISPLLQKSSLASNVNITADSSKFISIKDSGKQFQYQISNPQNPQFLQSQTVTRINSNVNEYNQGDLIAIQPHFICYILNVRKNKENERAKWIRILSRKHSATKELIKLDEGIYDFSMPPTDSQRTFLAIAAGTTFALYELNLPAPNQPIECTQTFIKTGLTLCSRIQWKDANQLVLLNANEIRLFDVNQLAFTESFNLECDKTSDIGWSKNGSLAIAHDHLISIWTPGESTCDTTWDPYHNVVVDSVIFSDQITGKSGQQINGELLITGAFQNTVIRVWETRTLDCLQEITFSQDPLLEESQLSSPAALFHLHYKNDHLFITNAKSSNAYALQLVLPKTSTNAHCLRFQRLLEFDVGQPLYHAFLEPLEDHAFHVWAIQPQEFVLLLANDLPPVAEGHDTPYTPFKKESEFVSIRGQSHLKTAPNSKEKSDSDSKAELKPEQPQPESSDKKEDSPEESLPNKEESLSDKEESLPDKEESLPDKGESLPDKEESLPDKKEPLGEGQKQSSEDDPNDEKEVLPDDQTHEAPLSQQTEGPTSPSNERPNELSAESHPNDSTNTETHINDQPAEPEKSDQPDNQQPRVITEEELLEMSAKHSSEGSVSPKSSQPELLTGMDLLTRIDNSLKQKAAQQENKGTQDTGSQKSDHEGSNPELLDPSLPLPTQPPSQPPLPTEFHFSKDQSDEDSEDQPTEEEEEYINQEEDKEQTDPPRKSPAAPMPSGLPMPSFDSAASRKSSKSGKTTPMKLLKRGDQIVTLQKNEDLMTPNAFTKKKKFQNDPAGELPPQRFDSNTYQEPRDDHSNLLDRIENMFDKKIELMTRKMEAERIQREKIHRQNQEKLLVVISQTLNNTITKELNQAIQIAIEGIIPTLSNHLTVNFDDILLNPLKEHISNILSSTIQESLKGLGQILSSQVSSSVSHTIHQPVQQAFKSQFQEVLVPGFQKASENMFQQLNTTFQQGLQQKMAAMPVSSAANVSGTEEHTQVKRATDSLLQVNEVLTRTLVETQHQLLNQIRHGGDLSTSRGYTKKPDMEPVVRQELTAQRKPELKMNNNNNNIQKTNLKEVEAEDKNTKLTTSQINILAALKSSKFSDAFSLALSARNISTLLWTCKQCSPQALSTYQIPQTHIICIIQQLSVEFSTQVVLKFKWLHAAAHALDTNSDTIKEHGHSILNKALSNIKSYEGEHTLEALAIISIFNKQLQKLKKANN